MFVEQLREYALNHPKDINQKEYSVIGFPEDVKITRWKIREHLYYDLSLRLPTRSRGLFTYGDQVICRGYNKFFNTGETNETKIDFLKTETRGPYYATLKENGFLVLIGALNGRLVVTSKNSSGDQGEGSRNHALVARDWVLKQLKSANKTESELADLLQKNNWTAVGEVCDDSFEEHVLPYPAEKSGVYLNGLNLNRGDVFETMNPSLVYQIGKEFGFMLTEYLEFNTYDELDEFLQKANTTGTYLNREIEGFVIRCKLNNTDFFWKHKFEEPYLMYREWREVVKTMLHRSLEAAILRANRKTKHAKSSLEFLTFANHYIKQNPHLKDQILKNQRGIFEIRNAMQHAKSLNNGELDLEISNINLKDFKVLLVTVAIVGCGKSTVAETLKKLVNWEFLSSDDMPKKAKIPTMVTKAFELFQTNDVVLFDHNNPQKLNREMVFNEVDNKMIMYGMNVKVVCLNYLPHGVNKKMKSFLESKVIERGDNHQELQLSVMQKPKLLQIVNNFTKMFQIVDPESEPDSNFDMVIDLKPGNSLFNVKTILNKLRTEYSGYIDIPTVDNKQVESAIDYVLKTPRNFKLKKVKSGSEKKALNKTKYFGLMINKQDYKKLIDICTSNNAPLDTIEVQRKLHATIAHVQSHPQEFNALKQKYQKFVDQPQTPTMTKEFKNLTVTQLAYRKSGGIVVFKCLENLHITVGTAQGIPHKDSVLVFEESDAVFVDFEPIVLRGEVYASA